MTTFEERLEKTFAVGRGCQLTVSNVTGSITVQADERDDVHLMAVKRLDGHGDPDHTDIQIYQEGNRIIARTRFQNESRLLAGLRGKKPCAVDYTVHVPTHCDMDVNQITGTVQVSGVSGQVAVNVVEGAVDLREIVGRTRVKAVSAAVDGSHWSGRATVNTVSGPIDIADANLSRVKANTVSGAVSIDTSIDKIGQYIFHSVSGDVSFVLPSEQGVESHGSTISGHLLCDLPHEFTRRGRGGWRATINGGGPPVRFQSVSGDLVLAAKTQVED
jgi:hypothetical protein